MAGRLYVVGVGPGDPELLTLKGARILKGVGCICVPKGKADGTSLALSIAEGAVDLRGKQIVETYFPMIRREQRRHGRQARRASGTGTVTAIFDRRRQGHRHGLHHHRRPRPSTAPSSTSSKAPRGTARALRIEIVPGIISINASAARAGSPWGSAREDRRPARQLPGRPQMRCSSGFGTVVLMKVHRVFDEITARLAERAFWKATLRLPAGHGRRADMHGPAPH